MPSNAGRPSTQVTATARDEALKLLQSGSPHERLRGARFFVKYARSRDFALLRRARSAESDSYVIRTLEIAIERAVPPTIPANETDSERASAEISRRARIDAIDWISGLLLHEIASPLGLIAEVAPREVPRYESSQLRQRIEHLQKIFQGIEQFRSATSVPHLQEFDVSNWLEQTIAEEPLTQAPQISYQGPKPFMIVADQKLLRFAVCNGVKNAIEALHGYDTTETYPLILAWGENDSDFWIAIRDRGPGIIGSPQLAFQIGKTTKKGHSGFGLAIARQAMESMNGDVTLQPGRESGAVYEVKWPKP